MKRRTIRWATGGVLAAAGLLFVTSASNADGTDLRGGRYGDLADLVRAASERSDDLADRVATLQEEVDALAETGRPPEEVLSDAELATKASNAGLTAVEGPGVNVVLDDAEVPDLLPDGTTVDDYLVHQQDVEAVLNALWAGGAEAVSVMDRRIVATSAVRCVGPVLLLDGRTYYPPYRIDAIGDQEAMQTALELSPQVGTYQDWVDALGLGYEVTPQEQLRLPAYDGALSVTHAQPAV